MNQLELIQSKIYEIRGQRVMLDFDLAEMYGTETKYLKRRFLFSITDKSDNFLCRHFLCSHEILHSHKVRNYYTKNSDNCLCFYQIQCIFM